MKKIFILMLVLKMASMAYATMTFEFRDAAGTTPLTNFLFIEDFTFFVMGEAGDTWKYGVYATDQNPGGGIIDMTGATVYSAAGDMGSIIDRISSHDGVNLVAGDIDTNVLPNQATGDWFRLDFSFTPNASDGDTASIDIIDYLNGYTVLSQHWLPVVPEPMTLVLLGLGAVMVRRKHSVCSKSTSQGLFLVSKKIFFCKFFFFTLLSNSDI